MTSLTAERVAAPGGCTATAASHRFLVLTELFLPTKGGTAVWFDEAYRRLGGRDIHIVTAQVPGADGHDRDHPNSVHRVRLERHWWLRPESLGMYAALLRKSLALALRYRFEAVHAGRVLPEGLVGLAVARLARVPLVIYAHGEEITTWRQPGKLRAMRYAYRHAEGIIANSVFTRDELLKLGVDPGRVHIIHPGVDVRRFRPGLPCEDLRSSLGLGRSDRLVLSVGRLSRRKGFDHLIRALSRLVARGREAHLAIIGIGEDADYLRALVREAGVESRVHFLGHVAPDDLPRWYNACDAFAMPNREIDGDNEGFGMVFLEAAACGKPVVAGRDGGTGSAVIDGVTGLRVDGAKVEDIAGALDRLLFSTEDAAGMGRAALDRARREFAWEAVAAATSRLTCENLRPVGT